MTHLEQTAYDEGKLACLMDERNNGHRSRCPYRIPSRIRAWNAGYEYQSTAGQPTLTPEQEATLQWPASKAAATRLQCQCANEITTMARQLRGRGWLLDGDALAQHVRACLKPIAEQHRAGKVGDFWPYFCASVRRYVGANSEEIQLHARRTGADEGVQSMAAILSALSCAMSKSKPKGESLTELITRRADESAQSRPVGKPAKKPLCNADAPRLPGL